MVTALEAARQYAKHGWPTVPLNPNTKVLAAQGFTGRHEAVMTEQDWAAGYADGPTHPPGRGGWNIAVRLPDGVIALDVDAYHGGEETMQALVAELGGLPETVVNRGRRTGGHLFYRVPAGTRLRNNAGPGVDVLQHHHRYSVVWPSVVDDRVYAPNLRPADGTVVVDSVEVQSGALREYRFTLPERMLGANGVLPPPRELPELPGKWLEHLSKDASTEQHHAADVQPFLTAVDQRDGQTVPCQAMVAAEADYRVALAAGGSRYDAMVAATMRVAMLAAEGHPGMFAMLAAVEMEYATAVAGEGRDTAAEFARASDGALEIAAGRPFAREDPCTVLTANVPEAPSGEVDLEFLPLPGQTWTDRHVAASALVFASRWMRPVDTGAWLAYGGDRWRWHHCMGSEGAEGAVSTAVAYIRPGEEGSSDPTEGARAALHKRMNGTGSAGVYTQARKLYRSEASPVPLLEADKLDAEPEQLWAGGQCWDLRASVDGPVLAEGVDPGTVHVHSAGRAAPEMRETPLWDAFLAAVWPDAEFRAWALRVLGITVTGYADRAMPILYGDPGTGKTSVPTILGHVLGSYYLAADPRLLSARDVHASIVLALKGARVAFIDEAPRDTFSVTERLKMLTGGGQLTGNRMRGNPETFNPTHSLILTSNDEPRVGDPAVRSRVRPMLCDGDPYAVMVARRAMHGAAWAEEVPGVLANLMAEAGRWLADPDTGRTRQTERETLEALALESDPVALWVSEETVPEGQTDGRELWSAYATWCAVNGITGRDGMGNAVTFGRRLTQLVPPGGKVKRSGYWTYTLTPRRREDAPAASSLGTPPPSSLEVPSGPVESTVAAQAREDVGAREDAREDAPAIFPGPNVGPTRADTALGKMGKMDGDISSNTNSSLYRGLGGPSSPPEPEQRETSSPSSPSPVSADSEALEASVPLPAVVFREGLQTVPLDVPMAAQVGALWVGKDVTLDVEHTGYPIGHRDYWLKTIQLGDAHTVLVLDATVPEQVELAAAVLDVASAIVCHSAQADVIPVAQAAGLDPARWWPKVTDTAVLAALEDPATVSKGIGIKPDYSLKALAAYVIPKRLGVEPVAPEADKGRAAVFRKGKWLTNVKPTTPVARSGWAQIRVDDPAMVVYAASDVLDTTALRQALPTPDPALLERERTVLRIVAKVSEVGVPLDGPHVLGALEAHEAELAGARERLAGLGLEDPGSNTKVAAALEAEGHQLPRTEKGNTSVAADVLDELTETPLVKALLEWRDTDKVLGTYLRPYATQVQHGDGRLRPTVQTLGAATTGRMSCVRPNLQQVPREGGIRGCVVADPGMMLVSADFSGVELRVAAALSRDQYLAGLIRDGLDIHKMVAQTVWGPEATKGDRYQAKRGVFGWLYGGGLTTIAKQLGGNEETARQVISALTKLAPGLVRWSDAIRDQVRNQRMPVWRHPSGRLTYLPHKLPHKAVNLCVQSTARELLVDAMLRWDAGRWGGGVLLPIHDEVVAMVPEAEAAEATAFLSECMTSELLGVPIVAEASAPSDRWQDSA